MFASAHLFRYVKHLHPPQLPFLLILSIFAFTSPETIAREFTPATLTNGVRMLVIERPHTDTVTINFYIGIGRINEPECGAANLLLHMLFRGSKNYTAPEITKELATIGGRLGYYVGYLSTVVSISLPSGHPFEEEGGFDRALTLLANIISNPILDTDELEKERTLILQKMAISKDFPASRFFEEIMLRLFPNHPFGRPSEGTEESVKKLNAELLKSYHSRFYAPENISVVIVGNVTKEAAEENLKETFSILDAGRNGHTLIPNPLYKEGIKGCVKREELIVNRCIILNEHVTQAQIFVGIPVPGLNQKERHILLVMDTVLSGLNGRLFNTLRKKRGCVYSVGVLEAIYPDIGVWGIYAGTDTRELSKTEELIVSEIKRLIRQPVEDEELATAQKLLETAISTMYETNSSTALEAGSSLVRGEAILPLEDRIKLAQSVTSEDIQFLAARLFGKGDFNVIVMK